jgi:hypothetical protein
LIFLAFLAASFSAFFAIFRSFFCLTVMIQIPFQLFEPFQQFRQLCNIRRDTARLLFGVLAAGSGMVRLIEAMADPAR